MVTPGWWATVAVCLPILNNIKFSKFPIYINFTNSLRKLFFPKYAQKSPENLQNSPKLRDEWYELRDFDCLKFALKP